jgi:translation elongation factor P/translation initiation factor 5A
MNILNTVFKRKIATEIQQVKRGNVLKLKNSLYSVLSVTQRGMARTGAHYKVKKFNLIVA